MTQHGVPTRRAALALMMVPLGASLASLAALSGCSGPAKRTAAPWPAAPLPPVPSFPLGNDVAIQALGLVGTPYRLGGNDLEQGVDCSAFIGLVFRRAAGMPLPRTVATLQTFGRGVDRSAVEPGDIILFVPAGGRVPTHGGVVVGGGRFVHAPSTGGRVRVDSLSLPHWAQQQWIVRRPAGA